MHNQQSPIINNWYTNLTGQLFKVRMVAFSGNDMGSLVIEYIDGSKQIITRQEWDCLKLMKHNSEREKSLSGSSELVTQ